MTENKTELLPCPFCGGEANDGIYIRDGYEVRCKSCKAGTYAFNPDANNKARDKWNTRATVTPSVSTTLMSPTSVISIGCECCDFTGRIEVEPDSEFTHPCDTCQPELNKEFQAGYNSAEQSDDGDLVKALEDAIRCLEKGDILQTEWDLKESLAKHKAKVQG